MQPKDREKTPTMRISLPPDLRKRFSSQPPSQETPTTPPKIQIAHRPASSVGKAPAVSPYQELLQNLYDGVLITDPNGKITDANLRAIDFLLYSHDELCGMQVMDIISGANEALFATIQKNLDADRFTYIDGYCRRKNSSLFPCEIVINRLRSNGEKLCFFLRDITQRKQMEADLQESEEKFQRIVSNLDDILYSVNIETREFQYLSPSFERVLGYTMEDIQQMGGREAFLQRVAPGTINPEHRALLSQSPVPQDPPINRYYEAWWLCKDGTLKCLEDHWIGVYEGDRLISTDGVLRDITERKHVEEQIRTFTSRLEQSNQELEQFAAVASHDLQEPLRKILAFGDRLKNQFGNQLADEGSQYLDRMLNAAGRMRTLINDLLTLSRLSTHAHPFESVSLATIIKEVLSDLETRIEQTKATVEMDDLPNLDADPLQMRQLFQNLIANALKFHQANIPPIVKIRCRILTNEASPPDSNEPGRNFCQIRVEDNGIGFDEKYLHQMFAIFQRLNDRSQYEGSGIGLAVCEKIVKRHNGNITATSTPGNGATFIVTLPIKQITK